MTIQEQAREAARWWRALQPDEKRGSPDDRAAIARLRRATSPLEAAEEPVTIALARRLGLGVHGLEAAALCAAVLAHVREDDQMLAARRLGTGAGDGRAMLSPLRFRRLIQADSAEERLIQFRRAVALAGHKINVADLAAALLDWSKRRQIEWIFRYYDGEPPAASQSAIPAEADGATL